MSERPAAAVHPEIWALSELASSAGGELSGEVALGICGGAGLIGLAFRDTRAARSTLHLSGWNPFQSNLLAGLERLGLPATVRETSGRRRAAKNLDRALNESSVAALWVDGATIGLAPAELTGMSPTVVVVRAHGSDIEVADGVHPAAVVGADVLAEARRANRAHRSRVVTVTGAPAADLAQLYRRGLAATAVGAVGGPPRGSGAEAVAELARQLADDGDEGWTATFPDGWELTRSLVALHTAIVREDGLLRRGQAAFTAEAARATGIEALTEVAARYGELAQAWDAVADAALPSDVPELAALRSHVSEWALTASADATEFPLSAGETTELLHGLGARLTALAADEQATLDRLREILSRA